MKYFINLSKKIFHIKRKMSSIKLCLWPNYMFVNQAVPPGQTEQQLMITLLSPFKNSKRINLCRSPNDTIQIFIDRLKIKCFQTCDKNKKLGAKSGNFSIKVNEIVVSDNSKCGEIFKQNKSHITLEVDDYVFKVLFNAPMIMKAKVNTPIYEGLMLYPFAFENSYNVSLINSKYIWYKIDAKNEIEVGNGSVYVPTRNDVDFNLKLVINPCNEDGQFGPAVEILTSKVQTNNVDVYPYENRLKIKPDNSIRIVTYNILASMYTRTKEAKNDMFSYCPEKFIASSYRNPLLLKELIAYEGDILCLQEVEIQFFYKELSPFLKKCLGMDGIFLRKCGNKNEGLGCFYSSDKFNLLNQFNIKLNDLITLEVYCGSIIKEILNDEFWKQGLQKKTVLQVLVLELISEKKQIIILCNTHLISDPDGDAVRLFQALIELTIANKIKSLTVNNYPKHKVSVIFCGDFNSTPESGVYDLFTKLSLPAEHRDEKILNNLRNNILFKMNSAYNIDVEYSHFTQSFVGLLDYIYFTDDNLELIQVLSMPSHEDVIRNVGLPSILFPSDHLPLIADFITK
ncbi:Hypothetical protein CINCED_3A021156 [Cinara cedri]|nr:Hypothetical protein CINCED_3A021156 [Cinara cedri]